MEIRFSAGAEGSVKLAVYDVAGRLVRTLYHDIQTPGLQRVVWDGTRNNGARLVSGIYFIRIEAAGSVRTQKTVILR